MILTICLNVGFYLATLVAAAVLVEQQWPPGAM